MRTPHFLLSAALIVLLHPASHAAVRTQTAFHQRVNVARQNQVSFHSSVAGRHRMLLLGMASQQPETINPPTRATVFSYLVNLIRGFFSRAW